MWTTMASLGNRVGWLRFSGERYVAASASGSVDAIVTGLVSQAPAVTTLSGAALEPNAWRPSPHGVLWLAAGGSEIRFDPFPPGGGSSGGGDLGTYDACAEADECLPPVWFRVTDGDNDAPITDLTVSANGITVECAPDPDNDCWWICQSDRRPLLDGEYVMTVSAPGYHQKIVRFTVQTPAECGCCDCSCTGGYQPGTAVDLYTNGDTLPGCCAATATDPNHCGACGNVCEGTPRIPFARRPARGDLEYQPSRAANSTGPKRRIEPCGTGDQMPGETRAPFTSVPLLLFSSRTRSWPLSRRTVAWTLETRGSASTIAHCAASRPARTSCPDSIVKVPALPWSVALLPPMAPPYGLGGAAWGAGAATPRLAAWPGAPYMNSGLGGWCTGAAP
jgi:hypothetical protein